MQLDLDKFTELAEEVEEHDSGTRSEIYQQLDKAYETIAELIIGKKVKHKKVIQLLQQSGMEELKEHNFSGWWQSKRIKAKREETQRQYEEAAARKEAKQPASVENIQAASQARRASLSSVPRVDATRVVKKDKDVLVPWSVFVRRMKQNHMVGSDVISAVLVQTGVLDKVDKTYRLVQRCPALFNNVNPSKTLNFTDIEVWGNTLEEFVLAQVRSEDKVGT